jgi:hypothetical protein
MTMNFLPKIRKPLAVLMVLTFTGLTLAWSPAQAVMVDTSQIIKQNHQENNRDRLRSLLDREEVRAQLEAWGVNNQIAQARINSLTDEEVAEILERFDQLPAGGDGFGILVGAAVLVFIILLLTDILGYTDIFPFVKKHR